jgi:biopolymer transport protein ExbD
MASVSEGSGRRGARRTLDAPINLIPYIDLMTTIITFLMMTAVWIQVSALDVQAESLAVDNQPVQDTPPKPIAIIMDENGFNVSEDGDNPVLLPKNATGYDLDGLREKVAALKAAQATPAEVQVFSADSVKFDEINKVIDLVSGLGFPSPPSLKAITANS